MYIKENFKYSIEDGFCAKVLPPTNENKSLLETTLSETENEIYVKGITASEGAFDSVVDKLIAEYKKAGGDEIKKGLTRSFTNRHIINKE